MTVKEAYKQQVKLLLDVLPEVAKESCFALHGGTAINLFVRNMHRLSVDIDLTYVPVEDRNTSLTAINKALQQIQVNLLAIRPNLQIAHKPEVCKLLISCKGVSVKIEVNMISRGVIGSVQQVVLCDRAQEVFDAFCSVRMVSIGQLYGGKLCAALDRQHPRDLFDVKLLLENEGLTDEIKQGFIYALISSDRPIHELLKPNLLDQRALFDTHFSGMTTIPFTYEDFESIRSELIEQIYSSLNQADRSFLLGFNQLEPDWTQYPFGAFPSVMWKVQNLEQFKEKNEDKFNQQVKALETLLASAH